MRAARRSRRALSLPEQLLWRQLRQLRGSLKIRRQHPIGPYVADFYCPAARLIVEVDGIVHDERQAHDRIRDDYLRSLGLTVLRVRAVDVLVDPEDVAAGVLLLCTAGKGPSTTQPRG